MFKVNVEILINIAIKLECTFNSMGRKCIPF